MLSLAGPSSIHLGSVGLVGLKLARVLAPIAAACGSSRPLAASALAQPSPLACDPSIPNLPLPRFNPDAPSCPRHATAVLQPDGHLNPVLSAYRSQYPESVWVKVVNAFPRRHMQPPLAIDIAVASEGRAGVELAKRGFRVLSVGGDAEVCHRTLMLAEAANARLNLITAKVERDLVHSGAADLVTLMHGLHLLEPQKALAEVHRILKPGGKLVVAWNDRDLQNCFVEELEQCLEAHIPSYSRTAQLHELEVWGGALQRDGLFRLREYSAHANPVVLRNVATLADILNSQAYVRQGLRGPARKAFNMDVRRLVECRFGQGPLLLPLVTKMFLLEKTPATPGMQ